MVNSFTRVRRGGGHPQPLYDDTKVLLAERGVTVKWDAANQRVLTTVAHES
jgi:hypothetical protein